MWSYKGVLQIKTNRIKHFFKALFISGSITLCSKTDIYVLRSILSNINERSSNRKRKFQYTVQLSRDKKSKYYKTNY